MRRVAVLGLDGDLVGCGGSVRRGAQAVGARRRADRAARRSAAAAAASRLDARPRPRAAAPPRRTRSPTEPPPRPLRRCFPAQPAWVDAPVADLLDHAAELFDARRLRRRAGLRRGGGPPGAALGRGAPQPRGGAAASRAARRGARRAELALALGPTIRRRWRRRPICTSTSSRRRRDRSAIGLEYARRGQPARLAPRQPGGRAAGAARGAGADRSRARGRSAAPHRRRARRAAEAARRRMYERGVALFELCRFGEARATFEQGAGRRARSRARALPPGAHRGAHRRRRGGRAPPGGGDRGGRQVVPAGARRSPSPTSPPACSARWPRFPPTIAGTSPASTCRPPTSRRSTT